MKQWMKKYQKALVSGAVCLVLALALALGGWAVLRTPRQTPQAPENKPYPGLNIDQIGLRYDRQTQEAGGAAGGEGTDGQSQPEETPPEQPPQEPEQTPPEQQEQQEPQDTGDKEQPAEEKPDEDKENSQEEGDKEGEEQGDEKDGDEEGKDDDTKGDETDQPIIATDLKSGTVSQEELNGDLLHFTATVLNGDEDTYLRARIKNSDTNGKWITASGDDYVAQLALGRNEITLLLKRGSEILGEVTYVINYRPAVANEEEPEIGDDPPTIRTNLSGDVVELNNRNLTFTVWANDGAGNPLYQNHIKVMMDDKEVKYSTGSAASGLEYNLFLDTGIGGSEDRHTITIVAWDDKGNSTYKSYTVVYNVHDKGEKIGTATIRLDLTVLGLGMMDIPVSRDIFQDVPASYAVKEALEYLGYDVSFSGTLDSGFYLSRITLAKAFRGAAVPEELQRLLKLDGVEIKTPQRFKDSVGEFDYTSGSGWMYTVNGSYPGRGMSEYFLSDGDVLTLRFTLARGKDIGDSGAAGGFGKLPSYCGTWYDGVYTPRHTYENGKCSVCGAADPNHTHQETETVTKPATCTEAGEKTFTCADCGQTHTETIPATGHQYAVTKCQSGEGGYTVTFHCDGCGGTHTETVSAEKVETLRRTEATCSASGSVTYRITAVVDGQTVTGEVTETLPQREHSYENGVCSGCGQRDPNAPDPDPDPDPENPDPDTPDPDPASGGEENLNEEETA